MRKKDSQISAVHYFIFFEESSILSQKASGIFSQQKAFLWVGPFSSLIPEIILEVFQKSDGLCVCCSWNGDGTTVQAACDPHETAQHSAQMVQNGDQTAHTVVNSFWVLVLKTMKDWNLTFSWNGTASMKLYKTPTGTFGTLCVDDPILFSGQHQNTCFSTRVALPQQCTLMDTFLHYLEPHIYIYIYCI